MTAKTTGNQDRSKLPDGDYRPVHAARGSQLSCQGWPQEAALRALMNSLDEEVAEHPRELITCGSTGKVLCDWDSYEATVKALRDLKSDETLLVQSGKPVGVFETHQEAPRVLIVSSKATGGGWTYVGSQGYLPIAFQTLDAVSQKHFSGNLAGKLVVSGGMGAAGGALSLAAGLHGAAFLGIEVDNEKIKRRIREGYCDYCVNTLDEALRILKNAVRQKQAVSVGLIGNCADIIPELASRGVVPDVLTDQTSAHDLLNGYLPSSLTLREASTLRNQNTQEYLNRVRGSMARHIEGMLALQKLGSVVFDFGNNIQAAGRESGVEDASAFSDFVSAYLEPLLREGLTPIRWIALSGESQDIQRIDTMTLKLFADDAILARWIPLARKYARFQGLPARVCRLGPDARIVLAEQVNNMVAKGEVKAPVIIALEPWGYAGSSAMESNQSGPWISLNALLGAASGASWVSLGQASGRSCQSTVATVVDGTREGAKRHLRVLENDGKVTKSSWQPASSTGTHHEAHPPGSPHRASH